MVMLLKLKTSELIGLALDWAVAQAEGFEVALATGTRLVVIRRSGITDYFDPSTNWGWCGPIIYREKIGFSFYKANAIDKEPFCIAAYSTDYSDEDTIWVSGSTPLIAAMRCYCCRKLGAEVEIPEELRS